MYKYEAIVKHDRNQWTHRKSTPICFHVHIDKIGVFLKGDQIYWHFHIIEMRWHQVVSTRKCAVIKLIVI